MAFDVWCTFISSQLVFKSTSQVSHMLLISQLIKRWFFTFLQIFPSSCECLCWNTCFQKINYRVPGCHIIRTGSTEVLTKRFGMQNAGNTHIQWRRRSVSLCSVNSFSLLNTNYPFQNNTLLILSVKKSLGSVNISGKNQAHDDAVQDSQSLSIIFKYLLAPCVGTWHWETAFHIFKTTDAPLHQRNLYLNLTFIIMQKEFLFYPQMHFTRAGVQCGVEVNFFCLSPILLSTESSHTRQRTASLQLWCDRCIKAQNLPLDQAPHFTCQPYFFSLAFSHVSYLPDLSVTSPAGEEPHFLHNLRLNR